MRLASVNPLRKAVESAYRLVGKVIPCDVTRVLVLEVANTHLLDPSHHYQFQSLDAATVSRFSTQTESELNGEIADKVASGKVICMAALQQDELAAYSLFSCSPVAAELNRGGRNFKGIGLAFGPEVYYLFKAFVLPAHRGKNLNRGVLQQAIATLSDVDWCHSSAPLPVQVPLRVLVTTTDWTNTAFLASVSAAGFEKRAMAAEFVVFGRHFFYLPSAFKADSSAASSTLISLTRPA